MTATCVVTHNCQVFCTMVDQSMDQLYRAASLTETTDHNRSPIVNLTYCFGW